MDKFQIIKPSILLSPYIKQYWFLTVDNVTQGSQRLIPIGCIGLTFHRGDRIYSTSENNLLPVSFLSGQTTDYTDLVYSGTLSFISIIFQPVWAKAFFKVPMSELNNQKIDIRMLNDPQILELEKRLTDTMDNDACVSLIENFLLRRIYEHYNHKRLTAVIESINDGQSDISALAQTACLGYKQFKRIFTEYVGANPKDFLRIARFQRAVHMLQIQPQITLTQLADACDYYDMSHLIKELKEFSGYTPGEYLSLCDPYSDYHSLFRSAFLDNPVSQI
jgi:AraC-like DNA-binding protein